jgi:hypothetical protein|tara:strand:+ start:738 stop:938 length:201 start_codon:yes stop_codon:yes gene_type:complete
MDIQNFISNIAAGDNAEAKDTLDGILSAKAFDALQSHKQELAKAIFGGNEEDEEVEEDSEEVSEEE